jgi:ferrous iron transport protein A
MIKDNIAGNASGPVDDNPYLNLRAMQMDQKGVIRSINARGELGRRIRDMGLVPGAEFMVIGRAPLYDPVALRLKGFTLTLRNNEADFIFCETVDQK